MVWNVKYSLIKDFGLKENECVVYIPPVFRSKLYLTGPKHIVMLLHSNLQ